MTTMRRFVPAFVLALALPSAALAQDEGGEVGDTGGEPAVGGEAAATPAEGGEASATATASPVEGEAYTAATYPTAVVDRPLEIPRGMFEIGGSFGFGQSYTFDVDGDVKTNNLALAAGVRYGVIEKLEVGLATTLLGWHKVEGHSSETELWDRDLDVHAAYGVYDSEQLDVSARVEVPFVFRDGTHVGVVLGAETRYLLLPQLAIYAGHGLVPIQFDPTLMDIDLNLGVGYQITGQLFARLDTQVVSIAVAGDGNDTTHYGDAIPLTLTGLFAITSALDVYGFFGVADAADPDFIAFGLGAAYRL